MYRTRENHLKKGTLREMLSRQIKQERNIIYVSSYVFEIIYIYMRKITFSKKSASILEIDK